MAKKEIKDLNAWERFIRWTEANQKVIWVVLLALISFTFAFPVGQVFDQNRLNDVHSVVYGKPITIGERNRLATAYGTVLQDLSAIRSGFMEFGQSEKSVLPAPLAVPGLSIYQGASVDDIIAFRRKAELMGFRVSEEELSRYVKELWWAKQSLSSAAEVVFKKNPNPTSAQQWQLMTDMQKEAEPLYAKLRDGNYWDAEKWRALVEPRTSASKRRSFTILDYEQALRDLCMVAKLEAYVRNTVQVGPQEVFESYQKEDQRRRFSWVEFPLPAEVKSKLLAKVTEDQARARYDAQGRANQYSTLKLRAQWLLIPTEHFKAQAEGEVTEEALLKHYQENRESYRRPTILAEDAAFALRTAQEQAAYEEKRFQSFEECKDKVKEDLLTKRSGELVSELASKLRPRIYPPSPGAAAPKAPGASFADLLKEHPFLQTGTTEFSSQREAKELFAQAYTPIVDSWFRTAQSREVSVPMTPQQGEAGDVFYLDVEVRKAGYVSPFAESEAKIRDEIAAEDGLKAIDKAVGSAWEAAKAAGKDISALAAEGVEVEVDGVKVKVPGKPMVSTDRFLGKNDRVLIPRVEPPKEPTDDQDPDANLEPHKGSEQLLKAAFIVKDVGEATTSYSVDASAAFLLKLDEIRLPDPSKFKDRKDSVERQLLAEKRREYFESWRKVVYQESRPDGAAPPPRNDAEEPEGA